MVQPGTWRSDAQEARGEEAAGATALTVWRRLGMTRFQSCSIGPE